MGRRAPKVASKGISYYVLFWVAPMLGVVLAPLLLHAASADLSESTDSHMFGVAVLLLGIVSLSVIGCVLDEAMGCTRSFPIVLLAVQLLLLLCALLLGSSLFPKISAKGAAGAPAIARFLSHGPLLAKMAPVLKPAPVAMEGADKLHPAARSAPVARLIPASPPHSLSLAKMPESIPAPVIAQAYAPAKTFAEPAMVGSSAEEGWRDAGDGYCEDSQSHQELSSLHATSKTLKECQEAASKDPNSLGVDFTENDGACDIRFAAGVLSIHLAGYEWWGWGGGQGNPAGSGKQKHDHPTRCYARIKHETPAPAVVTFAPAHLPSAAERDALLERGKNRFSIVLACAAEGTFMVNTVKAFCDRTPENVLQEIIVVDDGTDPPLQAMLTGIEPRCKLKVLRHEEILGLMVAKQTGGDAATGEFIGFFDCHVCPNKIWHEELSTVLKGGPRRMAVPTITDLDIDTWDERKESQINSKCYIDFNAQFMWFEDKSDFIPVISGGLVALTQTWWKESGGFDNHMRGWGGENVDQSLRTWLCGGEIIRAKSSRIAHMWRVPSDSRTSAHYKHVQFGVDNIARVAAAWFDKFKPKYRDGMLNGPNAPDVSNIMSVEKNLKCKPYAYFLHRFRKVYVQGGVLPESVFKFRSVEQPTKCIQRQGQLFAAYDCKDGSFFHFANQNPKDNGKCCTGIRQWNAMECFDRLDQEGVMPYYCDVVGNNDNQHYNLKGDGLIEHPYSGKCVSLAPSGFKLMAESCDKATKWERAESFVPLETREYKAEVISLGLTDSIPDN